MQKINCQTAYRRELRNRILSVSMDEFHAHGVRAVKMTISRANCQSRNVRFMKYMQIKKNCYWKALSILKWR